MRLPDKGSRDGKRVPDRGSLEGMNMNGYRAELLTIARAGRGELRRDVSSGSGRRREARVDALGSPLRCVSSGYLSGGCSCRSSIPAGVVSTAWGIELARGGARGDRFFRIAWRGGVWLAYGLRDGGVRGVYCPSHSAERDERSFLNEAREGASERELALSA
jgi:hypothetical protein